MPRVLVGTVSSTANDKTIVITVQTRKTHPIYKKQYTMSKKFMAHDEGNSCKVGDKVSIVETRPLSARKRFVLKEIIERAALSKDDLDIIEEKEEPKAKKKSEEKEDAKE